MERMENFRQYYDEDTKIISMPKMAIDIPKEGMGCIILESLKKHCGKTAQIDLATGEVDSFDDLYTRTVRTAIKMKDLGIKPGDIITLCSHNSINCTSVFLAAHLVGAINASLDPTISSEDMEHLIKQVKPKMFFVSKDCEEGFVELCEKLQIEARIVVFDQSIGNNLRYEDFISHKDGVANFKPYIPENLEEICTIIFSSGSTGLPKGIALSHKYFSYHTTTIFREIQNFMSLSTLYWTGGIQSTLLQLRSGCIRTFDRKFNPVRLWEQINTYKIIGLQLYPHAALEFIECKPDTWDGGLQLLAIVGTATSKENIEKLRKAIPNVKVFSILAMTETAQICNPSNLKSYLKMDSVGVPLHNITYKVVDPETEQTLGFNQAGELRLKSEYILSGYYNLKSNDIWDEDGFFKTGDVVYFDEDFSFFVVDRVKEMFGYQGFHITPVKYEQILEKHPDIDAAILCGIFHEIDGCHMMAFVVPKHGSGISEKDVEEYYNEQVEDRARIRAGVKFLESMPYTASGKISRKELKKYLNKLM